jgi:hypothetical protein
MAKTVKFVDVPISEDRDIPFEVGQRIIGVSITNQGSQDITCAMGSNSAFKKVLANSDVSYGDINGGNEVFYLTGNLIIKSIDWPNSDIVLTYVYDTTGTQEDC